MLMHCSFQIMIKIMTTLVMVMIVIVMMSVKIMVILMMVPGHVFKLNLCKKVQMVMQMMKSHFIMI